MEAAHYGIRHFRIQLDLDPLLSLALFLPLNSLKVLEDTRQCILHLEIPKDAT